MEQQQPVWINISSFLFLSLQPFILQSTAEKTEEGKESEAPQETDTLR